MTIETMKLAPEEAEEAEGQNIIVVVGPFARPYREIMAIAEEYGEREIPKSIRDMPLDIKLVTRIHNDLPSAGFLWYEYGVSAHLFFVQYFNVNNEFKNKTMT